MQMFVLGLQSSAGSEQLHLINLQHLSCKINMLYLLDSLLSAASM